MDVDVKSAIAVDRAYVEGMRTGWNIAQGLQFPSAYFPEWKNDAIRADNAAITAQYDAALESRRREISAASKQG